MRPHFVASNSEKLAERLLDELPLSHIAVYKRGETIYDLKNRSEGLHLIIGGKVKVYRIGDGGVPILLDIYRQNELFGESALIDLEDPAEEAIAFEPSKIIVWPTSEIERIIGMRPKLGLALLRSLVDREVTFSQRLVSLSSEKMPCRLARSLVHFAGRFGVPATDGSMTMMPLPQSLLAAYSGASREVISVQMNLFRREGYLHHSRKGIVLFPAALRQWLAENS